MKMPATLRVRKRPHKNTFGPVSESTLGRGMSAANIRPSMSPYRAAVSYWPLLKCWLRLLFAVLLPALLMLTVAELGLVMGLTLTAVGLGPA